MPGPAPKPASKRRRYAKPASYGAARADDRTGRAKRADRRELGIDNPHPLIASMWDTVQESCEEMRTVAGPSSACSECSAAARTPSDRMCGRSRWCVRRRGRGRLDDQRAPTRAESVPVGQRVGGWVIHCPAVVCTSSPRRSLVRCYCASTTTSELATCGESGTTTHTSRCRALSAASSAADVRAEVRRVRLGGACRFC